MNVRGFAAVRALLVFGLLPACVDTAPLDFVEVAQEGGPDAGIPDALLASCRQCITADGGACQAALDFCDSQPRCRDLAECLLDTGCFSLPTLTDRIECGFPCLEKLGISAGQDPAIEGVLQVNACSFDACRSECLSE